jgi:glutamate-ammonia-ligase adenylyltransferase
MNLSQNHVLPAALPPDLAALGRSRWAECVEAAGRQGVDLALDAALAAQACRVMALSDFAARSVRADPEMLADLGRRGDLQNPYPPGALLAKVTAGLDRFADGTDADLQAAIRRLRRREMLRIAWRDLAGRADLGQTMAELSAFADASLSVCLALLHRRLAARWGHPAGRGGGPLQLVVLAMGKLGACELNFSSDIDLIFAYPEGGQTQGGAPPRSNEDFFTHLARQLVRAINETTADGFVFRVDTDLRPYGESGPLVMGFDAMEAYYQCQGREWERYAWIKARAAAGDIAAGAGLLRRLNPFVYRRYLDFGVYDALREMKQKISREVRRKNLANNIKLGPGGIREVEFFGQIFQLTRGGVAPVLQYPAIQTVLRRLADERLIPAETARQLGEAYVFLRQTENRLQEADDRQTHDIPSDPLARRRLAAAMGFDDPAAFDERLAAHMAVVHRHFEGLLQTGEGKAPVAPGGHGAAASWLNPADGPSNRRILENLGYDDGDKAAQLLETLQSDPATRALSAQGRGRLDRLMPLVIKAAAAAEHPTLILGRIVDLIKAIERRTSYIALLLENPEVLSHLVRFAAASPWLTDFLARHPVLLDELLEGRGLYTPPMADELKHDASRRLSSVDPQDLESQIEALCIFKQVNTLRVAAADIGGLLPLMKVSDRLSWLAEAVIEQVMAIARSYLESRHGRPGHRDDHGGFAVIAYGKLGGLELGYDSDVDLVFLYAGDDGQTRGKTHAIDNRQFYARLGQRMVHILTAPTRAGRLYPTDMRLRPSGSSGPLVSHVDAFRDYLINEAWTWEHQAIVRARAICGDARLAADFEALRRQILTRRRDANRLRKDVAEMRERLRRENAGNPQDAFDLKQDAGGMVDVEFLNQYLVLRHSCDHPELARWSDNVRILESLIHTGVVAHESAHRLKQAYLTYRATAHRLALQAKPARVPAATFAPLRRHVQLMWQAFMETDA